MSIGADVALMAAGAVIGGACYGAALFHGRSKYRAMYSAISTHSHPQTLAQLTAVGSELDGIRRTIAALYENPQPEPLFPPDQPPHPGHGTVTTSNGNVLDAMTGKPVSDGGNP